MSLTLTAFDANADDSLRFVATTSSPAEAFRGAMVTALGAARETLATMFATLATKVVLRHAYCVIGLPTLGAHAGMAFGRVTLPRGEVAASDLRRALDVAIAGFVPKDTVPVLVSPVSFKADSWETDQPVGLSAGTLTAQAFIVAFPEVITKNLQLALKDIGIDRSRLRFTAMCISSARSHLCFDEAELGALVIHLGQSGSHVVRFQNSREQSFAQLDSGTERLAAALALGAAPRRPSVSASIELRAALQQLRDGIRLDSWSLPLVLTGSLAGYREAAEIAQSVFGARCDVRVCQEGPGEDVKEARALVRFVRMMEAQA